MSIRANAALRAAHLFKSPRNKCSLKRFRSTKSGFLKISDEVQDAVHSGKPVVALETTIYTHGFPYPDNIALSDQLERIVRENGAVPASIGFLNGSARVGMSSQDMTELLEKASKGWQTVKLSRRDLGWICGQGALGKDVNGGTTIAGTMVLAHLAGIKVFATGGLGGVHKGGEVSMDVSADLTELGRTPVALVSSGCKSFLDIPRTLEYLETQGVGVGTFADGRHGPVDFPAFWTRESGTRSPQTIQDEKEAAAIIHAQFNLPLSSGLFFANPIPEEHSLSKEYMDQVMEQAVRDAAEAGVTGPENTPFVLSRIREITKGSTITANRTLVESNVARGAKVAMELTKLERKTAEIHLWSGMQADSVRNSLKAPSAHIDLLVAGSLALDLSGDYTGVKPKPHLYTSNPGSFSESAGGVGRNIAQAASHAGATVQLCSVVGDDSAGRYLMQAVQNSGMSTDAIRVMPERASSRYVALNDGKKELFTAMADMEIMESGGSFEHLWKPLLDVSQSGWLAVDANWSSEMLQSWLISARINGSRVAFEPVSKEKSTRLFSNSKYWSAKHNFGWSLVDLATPNAGELRSMKESILSSGIGSEAPKNWGQEAQKAFEDDATLQFLDILGDISREGVLSDALAVVPYVQSLLITLGKHGVLLVEKMEVEKYEGLKSPEHRIATCDHNSLVLALGPLKIRVRHFPVPSPVVPSNIVSVNGVGDTFFGVTLSGLALGCKLDMQLISIAQRAAAMTLQSSESVSPEVMTLAQELKVLSKASTSN